MKANDILFLGLKHKVTAISKSDGRHLWCAELPGGGLGDSSAFVTLACDESRVFAYAGGHLHCLDLFSGRLLWTDELPGYGFGLASLCLPGFGSVPDIAAVKHWVTQMEASTAAAASASVAAS